MKIELRHIKTNSVMSEETNCYSASLYIDGKYAGVVMNHGHGGCDEQRLEVDYDIKAINEWLAKNEKPMSMAQYKADDVPCDLEILCGRLVSVHQETRRFRRLCKSNVLVVDGDSIRTFKWKGIKQVTPAHIASVKQSPTVIGKPIVNEMSDADLAAFVMALA